MKHLKLATLTLLLTAAGSGLWAAAPERVYVILPELSKDMAEVALLVRLEAVLTDSAGKPAPARAELFSWKPDPAPGAWYERRGHAVRQVNFPSAPLADIKGLNVKLSYSLTSRSLNSDRQITMVATESMPLKAEGNNLMAAPSLPFETITIDGSGLQWGDRNDKGLAYAAWTLSRPKHKIGGKLSKDKPREMMAVGSDELSLKLNVSFICFTGKKVDWSGNVHDLRKSGLNVVLADKDICLK